MAGQFHLFPRDAVQVIYVANIDQPAVLEALPSEFLNCASKFLQPMILQLQWDVCDNSPHGMSMSRMKVLNSDC